MRRIEFHPRPAAAHGIGSIPVLGLHGSIIVGVGAGMVKTEIMTEFMRKHPVKNRMGIGANRPAPRAATQLRDTTPTTGPAGIVVPVIGNDQQGVTIQVDVLAGIGSLPGGTGLADPGGGSAIGGGSKVFIVDLVRAENVLDTIIIRV